MRYSNYGVIIETYEGWELKATGELCRTEHCRAKRNKAEKTRRAILSVKRVAAQLKWKERGIAPSSGGKGYDAGITKDSLWNGGGARDVPQGLKTAASGGGGDDEDGKGYV